MVLVLSPEPTSLVDAYAVVKVLSQQAGIRNFAVVINPVVDKMSARDMFQKLSSVTGRFLTAKLRHLPLDSILPTLAGGEATDATVLCAEAVGRLSEAIERLPERLRLVLSLHYIEDLTYREIAGILKVSEPRVGQLHTEAIGQLRKLLPDA